MGGQVDLTETRLGDATMLEVEGLVAGLRQGGVEHVCLNKTGVELAAGGLDRLVEALREAPAWSPGSEPEQWPRLELSQVSVTPCACGRRQDRVVVAVLGFGWGDQVGRGAGTVEICRNDGPAGGGGEGERRAGRAEAVGDGSRQGASPPGPSRGDAPRQPPR